MTFPMGGFGTYTPYPQSNPLFQLGGEVNDEDMRAFQDCMLGTGDMRPAPQAQQSAAQQQQQQQQQQQEDMDFNLSSAYEIPDFDLACAYLDQVGLQGGVSGTEDPSQTQTEPNRSSTAMMLSDGNGPMLLRGHSNGMRMEINTRLHPSSPGVPGGGGGSGSMQSGPFSYHNPLAHGSNQSLNSLSGGVCGGSMMMPVAPKPVSTVPVQRRRRGDSIPAPLPSPSSAGKTLLLPAARGPMPSPSTTPTLPTKPSSSMPAPPCLPSSTPGSSSSSSSSTPSSGPSFQRTTSANSGSSGSSAGAAPGGRLCSDTRTISTGSTTSGASSVGSRSNTGEGGGSSRASTSASGVRRKRNEPKTKTEAQLEKIRERNRILARRTRLRKKMVYESLQKQLTELKRENTRLRSNAKQQRVAANNGQGNGGAAGRTWTDGPDAGRESNCSVMDEDEAMGCDTGGGNGMQGSVPGSPPHSVASSQFLKHHGEVGLWSEAAVRRLLAQTQHTFAVTDACAPGHPIMYASPSFLQITGFTSGQLFGGNLRFLKGPLTDPVAMDNFYRCLERGVETSVCFQTYRADGTCYWAQHYLAPLRNHDGKVIQTMVMQCPMSFLSNSGLDLLDEDEETELEDDDDHFFDDDGDL